MERCPTEIWMTIFSLACVDDGSTGRAISLVSRYFYNASRSIKLQSLAIRGISQIVGIAGVLERTPPNYRRVRYLSVMVHAREMNRRSASAEESLLRGKTGRDSLHPTLHTHAIYDKLMNVLPHVLELIAPTLRVLHLTVPITTPSKLLPSVLPALVELHLASSDMRGQCLDTRNIRAASQCYPSLRRLRLGFVHHHHGLFGRIAQLAPGIVHLRCFIPEHTYLYRDLERALGIGENDDSTTDGGNRVDTLPETVQRVSVQLGPVPNARRCPRWASMYETTRQNLERTAKQDKRVVLIKP